MIAELALQSAVVTALKGNATLLAAVTGIFDGIPADQAFPYITVGNTDSTRWDTFGKKGSNVLIDLRVHSKYQGFKEAYDIVELVDACIDQKDLAVTGFELTNIQREGLTKLTETDGITRQVVARYRALLAPV